MIKIVILFKKLKNLNHEQVVGDTAISHAKRDELVKIVSNLHHCSG